MTSEAPQDVAALPQTEAAEHGHYDGRGFVHGKGCDRVEHVAQTCREHMAEPPVSGEAAAPRTTGRTRNPFDPADTRSGNPFDPSNPSTATGEQLRHDMTLARWPWPDATRRIIAIEREAAAGLLDQNDRLADELQDIREQLTELAEDRTATDPDDEWHRGFHEAVRRLRVFVLRGSGAEEAARPTEGAAQ